MAKAKAAGALESKGVDILKDGDAEAKLRCSFMAGLMKARPAEAEAELKILPPGELASTLQHHACWGSGKAPEAAAAYYQQKGLAVPR